MNHTMPKLEGLLDSDMLSQAVDPTAIISLIKETEATMFIIVLYLRPHDHLPPHRYQAPHQDFPFELYSVPVRWHR